MSREKDLVIYSVGQSVELMDGGNGIECVILNIDTDKKDKPIRLWLSEQGIVLDVDFEMVRPLPVQYIGDISGLAVAGSQLPDDVSTGQMTLAITNEGEISVPSTQGIGHFELNCTPFEVENFETFADVSKLSKETTGRFRTCNEQQVNQLAMSSKSKNTHKQTKWGVTIFREWLSSRQKPLDFEIWKPAVLAECLSTFYAELMNQKGTIYSRSALLGIRAAIQRYLSLPPVNVDFSIISGTEFRHANNVLSGRIKDLKRKGKDFSKSHPPISPQDITLFYSSGTLSTQTPTKLQWKVFFEMSFHFGRRGREGLRELQVHDIVFKVDSCMRPFATLAFNPMEKNHQGLDAKDIDHDQRLYKTDSKDDPYSTLEMYISKLNPMCSSFFQRPKVKGYEGHEVWYCAKPVGENKIGDFLSSISAAAGLKEPYTNHSIRATTITTLRDVGVPIPDIMTVTGHKSAQSISHYSKTSDSVREKMSNVLSSHITQQISSTQSTPDNISTQSVSDSQESVSILQGNFLKTENDCMSTNELSNVENALKAGVAKLNISETDIFSDWSDEERVINECSGKDSQMNWEEITQEILDSPRKELSECNSFSPIRDENGVKFNAKSTENEGEVLDETFATDSFKQYFKDCTVNFYVKK